MRTPQSYKVNLMDGVITASMLEDVLYSYNKRAKNWRNQERKYRQIRRENYFWYDKYDYEAKAEEKKNMLYAKKSDILSFCSDYLVCIHKLTHTRRIRIEDTEDEYENYSEAIRQYQKGEKSDVIYMNSYYNRDYDDYVTFINITVEEPEYYLYYEFPNYSFHSPISDKQLVKYQNLEVIELEDLTTYGKNINDLLSLQFCDKVWKYLMSKK